MGRRGPPPKPRVFRPMSGDRDLAGHRNLPPELEYERGEPGLPDWLSAEAKREWRRIAPELARVGVLAKVDRAALAAYCQAWAELADAIRIVEREGRIIDVDVFNHKTGELTGSIKKVHPAYKLVKEGFARVKQFLGEFGLTPSSRTRIKAAPTEGEKADPAEEFFGGERRGGKKG